MRLLYLVLVLLCSIVHSIAVETKTDYGITSTHEPGESSRPNPSLLRLTPDSGLVHAQISTDSQAPQVQIRAESPSAKRLLNKVVVYFAINQDALAKNVDVAIRVVYPPQKEPIGMIHAEFCDDPPSEDFLVEGQELEYYQHDIRAIYPDQPLLVDVNFESDVTEIIYVWAEAIYEDIESCGVDHVAVDIDPEPRRSTSRCRIL